MYDYIYIGSTPADEECAQVGEDNYHERSRRELTAFTAQMLRIAEANGIQVPEGMLRVKRERHDFGSYSELVCRVDTLASNVDEQYAIACRLEELAPLNWDEAAKKELGLSPSE